MSIVFKPLTLPNQQTLPNRLAKASMEENLADIGQIPGTSLINLYKRWAKGGAGLILTGNVMVSPDAMTGVGCVYLGRETLSQGDNLERFSRWAEAGKSGGGKFYMQINHPGRQVFASFGTKLVSASATQATMKSYGDIKFDTARALSADEIKTIIMRYADTAAAAEKAGFDGVEIHGAHGYLISQFLSPLSNLRIDKWGGSLENRAKFLLEIVRAVRARVSTEFGVGVKLNSADFQKGGFEISDAKQVVMWLNDEAVDFVELSGGNYESLAMMGTSEDSRLHHIGTTSTALREMYFLDFARDIAAVANMPIIVTGGVTQFATAKGVLEDGSIQVVGTASAICQNPNLPNNWKAGKNLKIELPFAKWKNRNRKSMMRIMVTRAHMRRMGAGKLPRKTNPITATIGHLRAERKQLRHYSEWLDQIKNMS